MNVRLPPAKTEEILPLLDRWAKLIRELRRLMTGSRAKTAQGNRNGGTNGPDPDYSHSYPPLRGRVRVSPVGIWRRDRYRWYSADHTRHLFVARAWGIVIFRNYVADTPDRVVSAEPGYSNGRVRSAMVDGGRGCPTGGRFGYLTGHRLTPAHRAAPSLL